MNTGRLLQFIGLFITICTGCAILYAQQAVTIERQVETSRKLDQIQTTITQLTDESRNKNESQDNEITRLKIYLGFQ